MSEVDAADRRRPRAATLARRLRRDGLSVRVRLTIATALLVGGALGAAGVLVTTIESERIEADVQSEIDQEFAELRELRGGNDPATGRPFRSSSQFLATFLSRNVPDRTEILAGYWDGRTQQVSLGGRDLVADPAFDAAVSPLVDSSGTTVIDTPEGRLRIDVQRVEVTGGAGTDVGALVVGTLLDRTRDGLHETLRTYTVVALVLLLLAVVASATVAGRLLAPLRTLRSTAESISESDLAARIPERGNDDITALTRTVNSMLDRLETAFAGQRRFLDDAGHELRTPLTVLHGHLELLDENDPDEVRQTRDLLLDETERMARLVGDLTLLAKSERPDFLRPEPVPLGSLVTDVLSKATALGAREWTGHVPEPDEHAMVVVDEQRVTQALLQLCDNAVKHTAPGQSIALHGAVVGEHVELSVADTGRGVPEADRERIFERFGRSAVPRGDEGFGLGLSIVSAIVHAHGGEVGVSDNTPHGARFTVRLPITAEEPAWHAS
ncbi:HAMP domain-containing histidine kinase [Nocardioidaceae bacterium]|nr:HAMP domain-containing histidine kinase [Nocardioidaceae bacterium]